MDGTNASTIQSLNYFCDSLEMRKQAQILQVFVALLHFKRDS